MDDKRTCPYCQSADVRDHLVPCLLTAVFVFLSGAVFFRTVEGWMAYSGLLVGLLAGCVFLYQARAQRWQCRACRKVWGRGTPQPKGDEGNDREARE